MKTYETVAEIVNDLTRRGYTYDFRQAKAEHPEWLGQGGSLRPGEFVVDELHRFEGKTDPADEAIVLAISSPRHGVKGMVINAFGAYADPAVAQLVKGLPEPQPLQDEKQLKPG